MITKVVSLTKKIRYGQLSLVVCYFLVNMSIIQAQLIERMEPPFWWTGMQNSNLQILLKGQDISMYNIAVDSKDAELLSIDTADSPNYVFLNLNILPKAKSGSLDIVITDDNDFYEKHTYSLLEREKSLSDNHGFGTEDVMYLITPDRFANGDTTNDVVKGMSEGINREEDYGRHGGDIAGITKHLDYISDMGFTAIWLNPVLENNVEKYSYHGYSTTDYYSVDPRFGSNQEYIDFIQKAKEKGIKVIMDMIANHCGISHWWMDDLPYNDWINYQGQPYQQTNHKKATLLDPYGSKIDRDEMEKGWFVPTMPDLNQLNTHMATYLIQNSIWWIEYSGIAGIRQDTYSYPDADFMAAWSCALLEEYPKFNIVGEEWVIDKNMIAYWQDANENGYPSCLPSLMDFPLNVDLISALKEEENWNSGLIKLYESLATDYLYPDPMDMVIFPDNHDMSRIFTQLDGDYTLYTMAIGYILTTRGIPQIYYGTEILMNHPGTDSHGAIRSDFPGGWKEDTSNAFNDSDLGEQALQAKSFMKKLLKWRKDNPVIHHGELMHYAPVDGIYTMVRYDENSRVMVIINKNTDAQMLSLERYSEHLNNSSSGYEIISGNTVDLTSGVLELPAQGIYIYELR